MKGPIVTMTGGEPYPMGATYDGEGVNFAVFSQHARSVAVCLFDDDGAETCMLLPERRGDIWFGYVTGLRPGQKYGLRAHGPWEPRAGHRFNPNKLLLDPYARQLTGHPVWSDTLMGYKVGARDADLEFDPRDSAPFMPRCVVVDPDGFDWRDDRPPRVPRSRSVLYEAHVKGLTARMPGVRGAGTFAALASDPVLEHLDALGVTAIELLPVHAFLDDRFLVEKNLTNYWGYQSIGFFAPDPRYLGGGDIRQFQAMVARLHEAGIEVLLDVVYNHTGEGNELGPTLSFRGLDNRAYYRLADDPRYYVNDTGTGNTLALDHPMVLRMVMDSLRYWVEVMHVDGFRFDLCTTLGRRPEGFDREAPFFQAVQQDPVLASVKLIAEPWDVGPGGYQLGAFPHPFSEWNDKFRDGVRRFWRGDIGTAPELAERITASALQFDHSGRRPTASVHFVTAHDGFTLEDLVSYDEKHNEANGEGNRDGHSENFSDNCGVEGPTDDPAILTRRFRRKCNLMATLLLSQGVPMLLAGDEIGNSQSGNNNAYCQDNETSWIDWSQRDMVFEAFVRRLVAFRFDHRILRQKLFLHSKERALDGKPDLFWHRVDGEPMTPADWQDPGLDVVCAELRTASGTPIYRALDYAIFLVFNRGEEVGVVLPEGLEDHHWQREIDTSRPEWDGSDPERAAPSTTVTVAAESVAAFVLESDT